MQSLYPQIEPFNYFELPVDGGHVLYVEGCGNPDGIPMLYVHGGPGGGCDENCRRFFDQGRYDMVCPPEAAWTLHEAWPEAEFEWAPEAGHSAMEPGIASAPVSATDRLGQRLGGET